MGIQRANTLPVMVVEIPQDSAELLPPPPGQGDTARSDVRGAIMTPPMNIATAAQPRRMGRIAASVKCVTGVTCEASVTLHTALQTATRGRQPRVDEVVAST